MSMRKIDCLEELLLFNETAGEKGDPAECLVLQMNQKCHLKKEWIRFLEVIASSSYSEMFLYLRGNRLDAWFLKRLMLSLSKMKKLKVISVDLSHNSFSFVSARDTLLEFQKIYFPSEELTFQFNAQMKQQSQESIVMKCGQVQIQCSMKGMKSLAMHGVKSLRIELPKDMSQITKVLLKLRSLIKKQASQFKVDIEKEGEKIAEFVGNRKFILLITIVLNRIENLQSEFFFQFPYSRFKQAIAKDINGLGNCFNKMKQYQSSSCWKSQKYYNVYCQSFPKRSKKVSGLMKEVTPIPDELFLGLKSIEVRQREQETALFEAFIPKYCSIEANIFLEFIQMYMENGEIKDDSIFRVSKQYENKKRIKSQSDKQVTIIIRYVDQSFLLRFLNKLSDQLRYGKDLNYQATSFKLRELPYGHSLGLRNEEMKQVLSQPGYEAAKIERRKRFYKELNSWSRIESILVTKITLHEISSRPRRIEDEYYNFVTRIRSLNHLKIKQNCYTLLTAFSQILKSMKNSPLQKPFAYLTVTFVDGYSLQMPDKNIDVDLSGNNRIVQIVYNDSSDFRQFFCLWKKNSRLVGLLKQGSFIKQDFYNNQQNNNYHYYNHDCEYKCCLYVRNSNSLSELDSHYYKILNMYKIYEDTNHDNELCSYTNFHQCTCSYSQMQQAIKYYPDFDQKVAKFGLDLDQMRK